MYRTLLHLNKNHWLIRVFGGSVGVNNNPPNEDFTQRPIGFPILIFFRICKLHKNVNSLVQDHGFIGFSPYL